MTRFFFIFSLFPLFIFFQVFLSCPHENVFVGQNTPLYEAQGDRILQFMMLADWDSSPL